MKPFRALMCLLTFLCAAPCARGGGRPTAPFPVLFDTGAASDTMMAPSALAQRAKWRSIPLGRQAGALRGDAVLVNDRLALVLRRRGTGIELYAWTDAGAMFRSHLVPVSTTGGRAMTCSAIRIAAHTRGAVELEGVYRTGDNESASLRIRLSTGAVVLRLQGGDGLGAIRQFVDASYVVVPDHFADHVVYRSDDLTPEGLGLPTDNVAMLLAGKGNSTLCCVTKSRRQSIRVETTESGAVSCDVALAAGQTAWVAVLEGPKLWHAEPLTGARREKTLAWRTPFPADWRASFVWPGGVTRTQPLQAVDGPPVVRLPAGGPTEVVAYPVDRSRHTPLDVFCLTDIMRQALGVGPCQYVLDLEGLGKTADATPAQVVEWLEREIERGRAARQADAVRARLGEMVEHVRRVDARIAAYVRCAERVDALCRPAADQGGERIAAILWAAERVRKAQAELVGVLDGGASTRAAAAAKRLGDLAGDPAQRDACRALIADLRALDERQTRAIATQRGQVRRILQYTLLDPHPQTDVAKRIAGVGALAREALGQK
ncbi:hypothetical protein HQ560_16970 [bacterium]|nr:hypothetical protein [bacterium]